jgi:K(+)-stimulated pyrophosphate-energized sodium pump
MASYLEEIKIAIARIPEKTELFFNAMQTDIHQASIPQLMEYFQINLMNPRVLCWSIYWRNGCFPCFVV